MTSLNISQYLYGLGNTGNRSRGATGSTTTTTTGTTSSSSGSFSSFPFGNTVSSWSPSNWSSPGSNSGEWGNSIKRVFSYLFAIFIVIGILLLFVHFFIRPVFKWKPGMPGIIPVPGWDDGVLFWKDGNTGMVKNDDLPIDNQSFDYTVQVDMLIQNPLQFATQPRLLLSRGAIRKEPSTGDSLLGILTQYNFAIALKPDTNDMIVSILNKDAGMESIILPNIPIQEPFRLTLVVMEKAFEVYLNGRLVNTSKFHAPPMDIKGHIYPATRMEANIVKLRNLKIWSRLLTSPEIRDSTPPLSTAKEMGAGPMPSSSSSCPMPTSS
jgi:hypothetical protein